MIDGDPYCSAFVPYLTVSVPFLKQSDGTVPYRTIPEDPGLMFDSNRGLSEKIFFNNYTVCPSCVTID